jgi:hypothetical protein
MKRPELMLGGVLVGVVAFIALEARRAPRRVVTGSAAADSVAIGGATEGLGLSHMRRSMLPPPPPRDYADISARLASGRGSTYLDDILMARDNNIARWVDRSENPILVWVQPRPGLKDFWPEFRDRAREAFYTWSASGVPIRFLFIDDSAAAEVRLRWVDRFTEAAAGKTFWARDQNWWIVDADIEIALHRPTGQAYDGQAIRAITLHEVGHLIGLDHSSHPDDIMAPRVRVIGLSPADLRTAALIYKLPPGSVLSPGAVRPPRGP